MGGGSGYSTTQNVALSGGLLQVSVGRGGRNSSGIDGVPTTVTYSGALSFTVFAAGGMSGNEVEADRGDGMYGGGGTIGNLADVPLVNPPGDGFESGQPGTLLAGGNGAGPNPGLGEINVDRLLGGGGGGSGPGSIDGYGGNGGGGTILNIDGDPGIRGGGGGGGAVYAPDEGPSTIGIGGNGGDGYVAVYFLP
jgi:hypothetical protein